MVGMIAGFLFLAGVLLVYRSLFVRPAQASIRAVAKVKNFGYTKRYSQAITLVADALLPFVRLNSYKEAQLQRMLSMTHQRLTPAQFISRLLAQSLLYVGVGLFFIPISFPLFLLPVGFAGYAYTYELSQLKEQTRRRREAIEMELPKLCSVVNSRLRSTRNVQVILESFSAIACPEMRAELEVTIADMKTGSQETALRRLEGRVGSSNVSDIIRGLISVLNGDDQAVFFQSKQYQLNNDYLAVKKKEIQKRPMKLLMPSMLVFLMFFLIILVPLGSTIGSNIGQIFS